VLLLASREWCLGESLRASVFVFASLPCRNTSAGLIAAAGCQSVSQSVIQPESGRARVREQARERVIYWRHLRPRQARAALPLRPCTRADEERLQTKTKKKSNAAHTCTLTHIHKFLSERLASQNKQTRRRPKSTASNLISSNKAAITSPLAPKPSSSSKLADTQALRS
jgi:hypothetical protein